MEKNKLISLLVLLLIGSNGLLGYLLLSKKEGAPAVALLLNGKESAYSTIESVQIAPFWNNYPYLVLTSEGKQIDPGIRLTEVPEQPLAAVSGHIICRYVARTAQPKGDSVLHIIKSFKNVVLVADSISAPPLHAFVKAHHLENPVYTLSGPINLSCERIRRSYLFILSKDNRPFNIYIPREEVPEVTAKYLEDNAKRAQFF